MSEENVELIRELYERLGRGNFDAADFFDEAVVFARYGSELGGLEGEFRGLEGMWAAMADYLGAWEGLRIEAERITDLGDDRVLVLTLQTARGKGSGVIVEHELGELFALRDGKIVRLDSYWNRAEALEAAGLSE